MAPEELSRRATAVVEKTPSLEKREGEGARLAMAEHEGEKGDEWRG